MVVATPQGLLSDADMFEYQRTVWSQAELKGYNELFDVTGVTQLESVTEERVADLADLAASMDPADLPSKLAILATNDLHFGLARMYERRREMAKQSNKVVHVFRVREEAMEWLANCIEVQ